MRYGLGRALPFLLALAIALSGCGAKSQPPTAVGGMTVAFSLSPLAAQGIAVDRVRASMTRGTTVIERFLTISQGGQSAQGQMANIPVGTWTLVVDVIDTDGDIPYTGVVSVEISPGQDTAVEITLAPNPGKLQLKVVWGSGPSAPLGVSAQPTAGAVVIQWQPVEGAVGYNVFRAGTAEGPWRQLNGGLIQATTFTDNGAYGGTVYRYRVNAWDEFSRESVKSEAVTGYALSEGANYTIRGMIRDSAGIPLAGVPVQLIQKMPTGGWTSRNFYNIPRYDSHYQTTDTVGGFAMFDVVDYPENPTHTYGVSAYTKEIYRYVSMDIQPVNLAGSSRDIYLDIVTWPAGAIVLNLVDETGLPYSGWAYCNVSGPNYGDSGGREFGGGTYVFGGIPAMSDGRVRVEVNGYQPLEFSQVVVNTSQDTVLSGQLVRSVPL